MPLDRSPFASELANPSVYQKLLASVQAEVGDQSDSAKLAYIESVMNRATARGMTLDQTISDTSYYPKSTTSKLGIQYGGQVAAGLHPLINQAVSGSNIANYATGNESGNVHSGGAPVTFNPGTGERFVIENPDRKWASGLGAKTSVAGAGLTAVPSLASTSTTPASPMPPAPGVASATDSATQARIAELNAAIGLTRGIGAGAYKPTDPGGRLVSSLVDLYKVGQHQGWIPAPRAQLVNPPT